MGSLTLLGAGPFLVRRFIEPVVDPRAVAWIYFGLLAALTMVVLGLSVFLFLFLAPHSLVGSLGTTCAHGAYCLHVLPPWVSFGLWLPITGLLGWLAFRMGWTGLKAVRASRRVKRAVLTRATRSKGSAPYPVYEAPDGAIFALTVGFRRPVVLISRGLRESLSPEELEAVLAHEEAHASGHDNLTLLAARIINSALYFLPGVTQAHAGVRRHLEMSADAHATRGTGDRLLVAASVSRVARLLVDSSRFGSLAAENIGAAFSHGELALERVERLAGERPLASSRRRLLCGIAALALIVAVFGTSLSVLTGSSLTGGSQATACVDSASR